MVIPMVPNTNHIRSLVLIALVLVGTFVVAAETRVAQDPDAHLLESEVRDTETVIQDTRDAGDVRTQQIRNDVRDITDETRARIREAINETRDAIHDPEQDTRDVIERLRHEVTDATTEGRDRIRERLEAQRPESYREARERYVQASHEYAEARRALDEERDGGERALEARKRVAYAALEQLERYLEMLEQRVGSSDQYTDEERESVRERIAEYREWLEAGKIRVDEAQSVEQLSNTIGTLRGEWGRVQAYARSTARQDLVIRVSTLLVQAQSASDRIEMSIAIVEEAGGDVEALEALKERLDARLETATERVREARSAHSAQPSEEANEIAHRATLAARSELSEVYLILRELIEELREANAETRARTEVSA